QLGVEDLHRHAAVHLRLLRGVDGAHPALADLLEDAEPPAEKVAADERVDRRGHVLEHHSARYLGIMLRHVGQSWCHSGPQSSTRLGIRLAPSEWAMFHDSPTFSARPAPVARSTKRVRSMSRCGPSPSWGRKCSGDDTMKSSVYSRVPRKRSRSYVPEQASAWVKICGQRHTIATEWNAPIDAPAAITWMSSFWQSVRIAGTTSWRMYWWNAFSMAMRCAGVPSCISMVRPATLSHEYTLIRPSSRS